MIYLCIRQEDDMTLMNEQFFRLLHRSFLGQYKSVAQNGQHSYGWYIKKCKWSTNSSDAHLKLEKLIKIWGGWGEIMEKVYQFIERVVYYICVFSSRMLCAFNQGPEALQNNTLNDFFYEESYITFCCLEFLQ